MGILLFLKRQHKQNPLRKKQQPGHAFEKPELEGKDTRNHLVEVSGDDVQELEPEGTQNQLVEISGEDLQELEGRDNRERLVEVSGEDVPELYGAQGGI